jgi:hypothetical protein
MYRKALGHIQMLVSAMTEFFVFLACGGGLTDFNNILGNRSLKEDPPIDNISNTVSYVE